MPTNEEALQFASEMYSALLADQSAISLLGIELFDEPLYAGEGFPTTDILLPIKATDSFDPVRAFLAAEGIIGEYFIKFNRIATPLGYLAPWARVELRDSSWFDFVWAIDPAEIHILSSSRDRLYIIGLVNADNAVSIWKYWKPTADQR